MSAEDSASSKSCYSVKLPPFITLLTLSLFILQGCAARARLKAVPDDVEFPEGAITVLLRLDF
jgi:hypothetical protein